jgi:hypothetical protein
MTSVRYKSTVRLTPPNGSVRQSFILFKFQQVFDVPRAFHAADIIAVLVALGERFKQELMLSVGFDIQFNPKLKGPKAEPWGLE